jgi:hypothetical protein
VCVCKENDGQKERDKNVRARTIRTRHMKLGMKVYKHTYGLRVADCLEVNTSKHGDSAKILKYIWCILCIQD